MYRCFFNRFILINGTGIWQINLAFFLRWHLDREFCTLLGKTRSTFDRWQKSGKIPKEDGHDPYPYWLENNVKTFVEHK